MSGVLSLAFVNVVILASNHFQDSIIKKYKDTNLYRKLKILGKIIIIIILNDVKVMVAMSL